MNPAMAHLIVGPLQTNCYAVADPDSGMAVVIDPGDEADRIQAELTDRHWKIHSVWITHAHFDHMAACAEMAAECGGRVALHPADLPLWKERGFDSHFGLRIPDAPAPTLPLADRQTLQIGGICFTVLHLPGHSPGHVGFYLPQPGWLFSGDVLFASGGRGRTDLAGGDEYALRASIRDTLWALPDSTIVFPGHGEFTTIGQEKTFDFDQLF
jgi:hydroxyacylglutathione hydrolase